MRIFALSDLHTDFPENWRLLQHLPRDAYQQDALIVAGDIADRMPRIQQTLELLRAVFGTVCYVPGNHDLWVRGDEGDSVARFWSLLSLCDRLGIVTRPIRLAGVWVVPLFAWYRPEFADHPEDLPDDLSAWADFHFCRWPSGLDDVARYFVMLNTPHLGRYDAPVLSFSHFLPRRDLLPPQEYLRFKALPWVSGDSTIDRQIRAIGAQLHIFGHTHINLERQIDGIRYLQNVFGYPRERKNAEIPLRLVYDSEIDQDTQELAMPV